jgi:hypothetical protein
VKALIYPVPDAKRRLLKPVISQDPAKARLVALRLAEAVQLLHEANLTHGAIDWDRFEVYKGDDDKPYPVLDGFEESSLLEPGYCSRRSTAGDVFALGSVLLRLFTSVKSGDSYWLQTRVLSGGRLDLDSSRLQSLIERCWNRNLEERPSIDCVVVLLSQVQLPVFPDKRLVLYSLESSLQRPTLLGSIYHASLASGHYLAYTMEQ